MKTRRDESTIVLLTPEPAAEALGIGRWMLYDLLRQGRLRSLRIGSCRRISTTALAEFVTALEIEQTGCAELVLLMTARGDRSVYRKGNGWEACAYIEGRRRDPITDSRMTVAEYLEYWLSVTASTVRASTHVRYATYVRLHAIPVIGHLRLAELKPMHLQQLYAKRLKAGSSPATVHHLHACLHRALAMAERWEQVPRNVARLVTPGR